MERLHRHTNRDIKFQFRAKAVSDARSKRGFQAVELMTCWAGLVTVSSCSISFRRWPWIFLAVRMKLKRTESWSIFKMPILQIRGPFSPTKGLGKWEPLCCSDWEPSFLPRTELKTYGYCGSRTFSVRLKNLKSSQQEFQWNMWNDLKRPLSRSVKLRIRQLRQSRRICGWMWLHFVLERELGIPTGQSWTIFWSFGFFKIRNSCLRVRIWPFCNSFYMFLIFFGVLDGCGNFLGCIRCICGLVHQEATERKCVQPIFWVRHLSQSKEWCTSLWAFAENECGDATDCKRWKSQTGKGPGCDSG